MSLPLQPQFGILEPFDGVDFTDYIERLKCCFLTNEQANKAEITILSARDPTRPGFQAAASWVAV